MMKKAVAVEESAVVKALAVEEKEGVLMKKAVAVEENAVVVEERAVEENAVEEKEGVLMENALAVVEESAAVEKEGAAVDAAVEAVVEKAPSRADLIRAMYAADQSRAEIAKALGIRYQAVYQVTKGLTNAHHGAETTGRTILVQTDGGLRPRREVIREMYAAGRSRGEIAKEFGILFQTVYQATKDMPPRKK